MIGRLFVVHRGELREVDPESRLRPVVDCAGCSTPVERMTLLRDGDGGWVVKVRCHGHREEELIPWRDLLAGDLVIGPAFVPDTVLVRRAP